MMDEIRVGKAWSHLLDNAIKFAEEDRIEVTIHGANATAEAVDLTISVRNTGLGIPEDPPQAIMAPFTQMERQSVNDYGGVGIGLSLEKRHVETIGGRLTVESEVGMGSVFSVTFAGLPLAESHSTDSAPE